MFDKVCSYLWLTGMLANVANIGNAASRDPRQCEGIQERDQLCIRERTDLFLEIEILELTGWFLGVEETICFANT